jgi:lactate dehydrogenase-like 2-hydroxyacid dehydrogenase
MKIEIITCLPMPDYLLQRLASDYTCVTYDFVADALTGDRVDVSQARAIAMTGEAFLREAFLEKLPCLEVISVFGVGYDGVPVDYCRKREIVVAHTPDVMTEDAADVATALVLMTSRGLLQADRFLRHGEWLAGSAPLTSSVTGKTAGIVGLGRIGRAIARRLAALGMNISYVEQKPNPGFDYRHVGNVLDLAAQSDFLIVACPGGPSTRNLVDASVIEALGPDSILINGARGSIVDEAALIDALKRGAIKGAGLDVYAQEPNVPKELIAMENVVLFPHIGSATLETRATMTSMCKDNLDSWFRNGAVANRIPEFA